MKRDTLILCAVIVCSVLGLMLHSQRLSEEHLSALRQHEEAMNHNAKLLTLFFQTNLSTHISTGVVEAHDALEKRKEDVKKLMEDLRDKSSHYANALSRLPPNTPLEIRDKAARELMRLDDQAAMQNSGGKP